MNEIKYKIIQDSRAVFFQPSDKRVTYPDGKDSPLLKRRVPKRPQQNPEPQETDDAAAPTKQDKS